MFLGCWKCPLRLGFFRLVKECGFSAVQAACFVAFPSIALGFFFLSFLQTLFVESVWRVEFPVHFLQIVSMDF